MLGDAGDAGDMSLQGDAEWLSKRSPFVIYILSLVLAKDFSRPTIRLHGKKTKIPRKFPPRENKIPPQKNITRNDQGRPGTTRDDQTDGWRACCNVASIYTSSHIVPIHPRLSAPYYNSPTLPLYPTKTTPFARDLHTIGGTRFPVILSAIDNHQTKLAEFLASIWVPDDPFHDCPFCPKPVVLTPKLYVRLVIV
jgi:hypothetical protein